MTPQIKLRTYSQQAYLSLRQMILAGEIPQGTKLTVRILAERLGLSPTPIKSALAGLEREGLIVSSAHRGYSVPRAEPADVAHAFELLQLMDIFAARKIAQSRHRASSLDRLERYVDDALSDQPHPGRWEMDFHRLLWDETGNPRLIQFADNLRGLILIACGGVLDVPNRREFIHVEHQQMVKAMRTGDVDRVTELHHTHFQDLAHSVNARLFPELAGADLTIQEG
ncbi:GntR family transcriptional regulator [Georgenia sp. H159]|uniref:GntR family transcriptional regulator n=1 Tax=Georgenia sp. H159 TaxID=3076115 RepID=UPI002D766263|nr:GntR family transcriptional regulator [Georgenia sp. H159]